MIYSLDHGPAHVHLIGPDGRARIALNCPDGPPVPVDARGMDATRLHKALGLVADNLGLLCKEWSSIHGTA